MKKVLFATTALVATAGVAAADVTLSGSAEMGIFGGDMSGTGIWAGPLYNTGLETQFHTDIDVTFTLSGTTDNGLTFGATIDLDEEGGFAATNGGPEAVFISGNFGTITMGDTDGAFDWAMNEVPAGPGSINDAETSHMGFNGNAGGDGLFDGQVLRYDHSIGALSFAVSIEIDDVVGPTITHPIFTPLGTPAGIYAHTDSSPVIGLGVRYDLNLGGTDMEIAVGYQSTSLTAGGISFDPSILGISLDTTIAGLNVGLNWSELDWDIPGAVDTNHFGIGVGYSMDAFSFGVNYGQYSDINGIAGQDSSGFGLSAGYDLGGGASILFGYSNSEVELGASSWDASLWSLGVSMSF